MSTGLQVLLAILSIVGIGVGGWFTVRSAIGAKRTPAYGELDKRVGTLEQQVGTLYAERHQDRQFIRDMLEYLEDRFAVRHHDLPFPLPRWLKEERNPKKETR